MKYQLVYLIIMTKVKMKRYHFTGLGSVCLPLEDRRIRLISVNVPRASQTSIETIEGNISGYVSGLLSQQDNLRPDERQKSTQEELLEYSLVLPAGQVSRVDSVSVLLQEFVKGEVEISAFSGPGYVSVCK